MAHKYWVSCGYVQSHFTALPAALLNYVVFMGSNAPSARDTITPLRVLSGYF